ncbi:BREX-2 system phosphatase PglZ [Micromonospora citrea]|uniref:BREX-2 system phosphatase PglZ n=1 Tax=Micromonospora citrea TaxID=47855 RepID=UPI003C3E477E
MTQAVAPSQALRINPVALRQKVTQQLDRHRNGDPYPVMVFRAEPTWPHDPMVLLPDARKARVVPCVSPLAVWEHLVVDRDDEVLVLLTDIPESRLGQGVRSRIFRQQVITVEPWDLVVDAFGAQVPDSALERESWAGEALLDAMPPAGWPKLSTRVLTRDVALRHLAAVRLGLERRGESADDLDVSALLRWSAEPGAVEAFGLLRPVEQDGLRRWLVEQFGRPARALIALVTAGHGADALPLGLVCDAVWTTSTPDAVRVQGRIDQYFGHLDDDAAVRGFADAAVQVVAGMVTARESSAHRQGQAVLHRAEELLLQFGAVGSAGHSAVLRTGFTRRVDDAARALLAGVADPALDAAVDSLSGHLLAESEAGRIHRIRMAQRLVRWLGVEVSPPASVADGVQRQIAEWGWVDLALHHVWAGDDVHPGLQQAFREIHERGQQRRRKLDGAFAERLAAWATAGPGNDGGLLTIENVLPAVVDPLIRAQRSVLLVVLDGMSAAVAVELADELSQQWIEYDPLGGRGTGRRRGVVAALPTLTAVSRTSLFAGALRGGDQANEKRMFDEGRWGQGARIFHKGPARGGAGEAFSEGLRTAMADPAQLVAVVINTVDESLSHGREGDEAGWQIKDLGFLRSLLDLAGSSGRAVIITSDHGHVLERGGEQVKAPDAASARHRTGPGPAGPGEVELSGPRVVAEGKRIIALWDPLRRYRPTRAGYHGGASLGEVTVPLLAYLLPNVTDVPTGWVPVEEQRPEWWEAGVPTPAAPAVAPAKTSPSTPKPRRKPPVVTGDALFDVPEQMPAPAAEPATGDGDLVAALLATELFQAQHGLTPRKVDQKKIEAAMRALLEAKGVLSATVLAQRAGELPARAGGFVITLQRIFNVDNYPVLSLIDDGRTVRLDVPLLRTQFGLSDGVS